MSASKPSIPSGRISGIRMKGSAPSTTKTSDAREVLIIGAGPGGLASAMLLAQAGVRVTVLERMNRVGGRTSAIEQDGFRFDLGPTFFLYPAVLQSIFAAVGRRLEDEVTMAKVDPNYRIHFGTKSQADGGGSILCHPDMDKMEKAIGAISPEDAKNVRRYIADNQKKLEAMKPVMERPSAGWKDWVSVLKLASVLRPWNSLDDDLRRYFKDERIRRTFSFQSKYLGMSPFNCPSMFSILSFLEYDTGVYHPIGGCAAVTEAMARVCREMGVDIRLNEQVEEVLFEGKKAVGVRTGRGVYRADALVINADFATAMAKLVPNEIRRSWTNEKLHKKKYSCSTFMMYLGLEGRFDNVAHHTVYLPDDYNRNLREIEEEHVPSELPSFYVQNASVTDPTLAPKGHSTLYVLVPTANDPETIDWNAEKGRYRKLVLGELSKIGITDVEKRIRFEKVITPAEWQGGYNVFKGAVFNLAHNLGQLLSNRPRNKFDELESVYLVGGGTHPGSGLPVIFESSKITTRLLLDDMGVSSGFIDTPAAPASDSAPSLQEMAEAIEAARRVA